MVITVPGCLAEHVLKSGRKRCVLASTGADSRLDGRRGTGEVEVAEAGELPHADAFEAFRQVLAEVGVDEFANVGVWVSASGSRPAGRARWMRRERRICPKVTEYSCDLVIGWPRYPRLS